MATTKKKGGVKKVVARKRPRPVEKSEEQAWLDEILAGKHDLEDYSKKKLGARAIKPGKVISTDEQLRVVREWFVEKLGLEVIPDGTMSEAEYQFLVSYYFVLTIILGARSPFNLRHEVKRYEEALATLKKTFPKNKKQPREDVRIGLKYYDRKTGQISFEGYKKAITAEFYGKDFLDMSQGEKTVAKRTLRVKVCALLKSRTDEGRKAAVVRVLRRRKK
jgi:hypothetical protein